MASQSIRKFNGIVVALAVVCAVSCFSLPIVHSRLASSGFYESGKGDMLMSYFHIGDGHDDKLASEWRFPTSLVVNAETYLLSGTDDDGCFTVKDETNSTSYVVEGRIMRTPDVQTARRRVFAHLATCNLPVDTIAEHIVLTPFDTHTNGFYAALNPQSRSTRSYLASKGLFMYIEGVSNRFDFAIALLNAGLPENERVPLNVNGGTQSP